MKKFLVFFSVSLPILFFSNILGLRGANKKIKTKVQLVKESLENAGYEVSWVVISEKRSKFFNKLLPNSAKKSHHLNGDAIDVYVFDIDGDDKFTQNDLDIVKKHNRKVERRNPELRGAFGTYTSKKFAKHMIHFDTRGYSTTYNH
jgi:uncharacterized protein YcbK (DUF882 family)